MSASDATLFRDSHALMMRVLLEQQQIDLGEGLPLSNRIDPKRLRNLDRDRLKQAFKSINALNWEMQNALSAV
jgi:signal-transduction protein with cAMP-binding, CBS, and nucleotidyltransferase domain